MKISFFKRLARELLHWLPTLTRLAILVNVLIDIVSKVTNYNVRAISKLRFQV